MTVTLTDAGLDLSWAEAQFAEHRCEVKRELPSDGKAVPPHGSIPPHGDCGQAAICVLWVAHAGQPADQVGVHACAEHRDEVNDRHQRMGMVGACARCAGPLVLMEVAPL
jgi:hypothetical protein